MDNRIVATPSSRSILGVPRTVATPARRGMLAGQASGSTDVPVAHPALHSVPLQDTGARTRQAQTQRQRFLAGLSSAMGRVSAPTAPLELTPEQTVEAWLAWAQKRHTQRTEKRQEATERVVASVMQEGPYPQTLDLSALGLKGELPPLPDHLTCLNISDNPGITGLASIPASLTQLDAERCGLRQLPAFPEGSKLEHLRVNGNYKLHTLPPMPPSLTHLEVRCGELRALPDFPPDSQLRTLHITGNQQLHTLPPLPPSLTVLHANNCGFRSLPPFPEGSRLEEVHLDSNQQLRTIPPLPPSVLRLHAQCGGLRELPPFAEGSRLEHLSVSSNRLRQIPPLPCTVKSLWADNNPTLMQLPSFPPSLSWVVARVCGFTALPELGRSVQHADFSFNRIRDLSQQTQPTVAALNLVRNPFARLPDWVHQLPSDTQVLVSRRHLPRQPNPGANLATVAVGPRIILGTEDDGFGGLPSVTQAESATGGISVN